MSKTFIIAEAGVNHNGDEKLALSLVKAASLAGADAVKFQTFSADKLVVQGLAKANYQERETGDGDQHSMLSKLELPLESYYRIFDFCTKLGIEFMSTPFDEDAADFLINLGLKRIKVPSGEITNEPFLRFLAKKGLPIILSTGMAEMNEIKFAVSIIDSARKEAGIGGDLKTELTILHCTSNYPAAYSDVNLRAMLTIARELNLPIGYSDHTPGLAVSTAAVALGATVIEKHFTLDQDLHGPDHKASLTIEELTALVKQIRAVEDSLGSPHKSPTDSELPIRALVRRSVTLVKSKKAGETLNRADLAVLRPGTGVPPGDLEKIIGMTVSRDLPSGKTLGWNDLIK